MASSYKIVRHFFNSDRKLVIRRGLTRQEAQAHCKDPETSSSTCTEKAGKDRTKKYGPWFDGFTDR